MEKMCPMCKERKPADAFALDRSKKDGHRGICKACNAIVSDRYRTSSLGVACAERRMKKVQERIEEDADFARHRRDIVCKSSARPEYRESLRQKANTEHGKEAKRATKAVENAIRSGELRVPSRCSRCKVELGEDRIGRRKLRAVHVNGYDPEHHLDVKFMCPTCVNRLTKIVRLT